MQNAILPALLVAVLFSSCSNSTSSSQQTAPNVEFSVDDFHGKTYHFASDIAESKGMEGADIKMVFNKDTTGTIRLIKGSDMRQIGFS